MDVQITSNAGEIAARLSARAAALRDVRPVLAGIAAEIDRLTAEALSSSRRVDGLPFPDLADSTKVGRLRQRKSLFKKAGKLSKAEREAINAELYGRLHQNIYVRRARALTVGPAATSARAKRREQILAAAKAARFKPLINKGRLRASARARVVGNTTIRWSVVDYGVPHIVGGPNGRPPKRNYSVFTLRGGAWLIEPKLAAEIVSRIAEHVQKAGAK